MGSRLTPHQKKMVRQIVDDTHIEVVIRELSTICREHERTCLDTTGLAAIGREWAFAAEHLDTAADEIEE